MSHRPRDVIRTETWWTCPGCGEATNVRSGGCLACERCGECCTCEVEDTPRTHRGRSLLFGLALLCAPLGLAAQGILDPDRTWDTDQWHHVGAGAALAVVMRGPWIAPDWNRPAPRIVLVMAVGVAYEALQVYEARAAGRLGQEGYGFGVLDLVADFAGAVAVEGLVALGRTLAR